MTHPETIKNLEKRYNVHITRDTFWNPLTRQERESFYVYTLDGCCWDKIISYRSLVSMLANDKNSLARINNELKKRRMI